MIKSITILLTLACATGSQAECLSGNWEIGDTGPGSSRVCETLEAQFPEASLAVVDRRIHSADEVSVVVTVDGRAQALDYRLIGADWVLEPPGIASTRP